VNNGFGGEGAVLNLQSHLLLLPELHILVPPGAVLMQAFEEILDVLIAAALLVHLGFEGALLFLFHFLEDTGCLQIDFFVAVSQFIEYMIFLRGFGTPCCFFGGLRLWRQYISQMIIVPITPRGV
jgi:hypothetical protein